MPDQTDGDAARRPLPEPPYWAVIFASTRTAADDAGYAAATRRMAELAAQQPGYLGLESARDGDGAGVTVSYWRSLDDIAAWKANAEHLAVQAEGKARWYERFTLRVARVERAYDWTR
jgi:heme-degrading monooxygenase HmoA